MKQHISPFPFTEYRDFLRAALKANGFTYRSFTKKHGEVVSFIMLAQTLSRGRSGTKNKPMRNLSAETLARLGKALRLKDEEVTYLILLKLENDSEVFPGPYGNAYMDCIRALIQNYKYSQIQLPNKQGAGAVKLSKTAETIGELIDLLPDSSKRKVNKEILDESRGVQARQKRRPGLQRMASVIQRLETLANLGMA